MRIRTQRVDKGLLEATKLSGAVVDRKPAIIAIDVGVTAGSINLVLDRAHVCRLWATNGGQA